MIEDIIDKVVKELSESLKLGDFLTVQAPDKLIKDAFLHDSEGNPIDCNIYHPKYGYKGFVTDIGKQIVTMWNPTIYTDPKINKEVYCIECLNLTCIHPDGKLTNKDGVTVIFVDFVLHNQTRQAETEQDFKEIYDKLFLEKRIENTPKKHRLFKAELLNHVEKLISLYKKKHEFETIDLSLLSIAKDFIQYLNEPDSEAKDKNEEPSNPVVALFCALVNDSKLIPMGENETQKDYCKRICEQYNLIYKDRVRQNYPNKITPKNIEKVEEVILPAIDEFSKNKILDYLKREHPTNKRLYG